MFSGEAVFIIGGLAILAGHHTQERNFRVNRVVIVGTRKLIGTLGTYATSNITLTRETGQPAGVASFRQIAAFVEANLEAAAG